MTDKTEPTQAFEGYPGDYQYHVEAAKRNGGCIPKELRKPRQRNAYCTMSGKRIRDMDGRCQACESW